LCLHLFLIVVVVGCLQPSHRPRFLPVVRGGGYGVGFGGFSESLVEHLPRPMTAASMDIALLAASVVAVTDSFHFAK
jgi:hypothetical protein